MTDSWCERPRPFLMFDVRDLWVRTLWLALWIEKTLMAPFMLILSTAHAIMVLRIMFLHFQATVRLPCRHVTVRWMWSYNQPWWASPLLPLLSFLYFSIGFLPINFSHTNEQSTNFRLNGRPSESDGKNSLKFFDNRFAIKVVAARQ